MCISNSILAPFKSRDLTHVKLVYQLKCKVLTIKFTSI